MSPAFSALLLLALAFAAGCRDAPQGTAPEQAAPLRPIADVLADHAPSIMAIEGVAGIYEGRTDQGAPCIHVLLIRDSPELRARLPRMLEGWPVIARESGEIRAMPDSG